jgi:hypothetical protein
MHHAARTLLVAVGIVLGGALFETLTSSAATGPAVIRITDGQTSISRVDVGEPGRSPGDMQIVSALVFNRRLTPRALGHFELVCTFTVGINRSCNGTVFLPKGKLVVSGVLRYRQFYELAIVGGTGLYDNARGTMTVTRIGESPLRSLLFFRLTG